MDHFALVDMSMSIPLRVVYRVSVYFLMNHKVREVDLERSSVLDLFVFWREISIVIR